MKHGIEYECHNCGHEAVEGELTRTPGKRYVCPGCGYQIHPKMQPPTDEERADYYADQLTEA